MAEEPHILIVEDQPTTAEMLTSYFKTQGYQVTTVGWGKDALAFVEETVPDLVVLDIRLPDIDGYEVCRRLRDHRRTAHVPVIFLTERRERSDRIEGLKLGAVDYITKPFDIQELRLRVRNVLRRTGIDRMTHVVTGLPSVTLAEEQLDDLLARPDWALLSVGLRGLDAFAEVYGFVARDDVMRAVALMLNHVVAESSSPDAFVGHLDDTNFFLVVAPDDLDRTRQALDARLSEAMAFFYPRADWEAVQNDPDTELPRLVIAVGTLLSSQVSPASPDDLRRAIIGAQQAE